MTKSNFQKTEKQDKLFIHPEIENKFKLLLKIMSWIVGISFVLIILLPLIESHTIDVIVKILYYIGLINLLLFAVLEFFAQNLKVLLSKNKK
jgi:hypothetical protein